MIVNKNLTNLISSKPSYLDYEEDNSCPVCKAKISPVFISCSLNTNDTGSVFNYCRGCCSTFVTNYRIKKSGKSSSMSDYYEVESIISSVPNMFKEEAFSEEIIKLSPIFVKIYNQALAAETSSLDEIAGLGYRKSLEFLIKDFAISENPKDEADIKKMQLAPCIKQYITDPNVKTLATRTAWLGNDEAHYIRKHDDRDITDMKLFIKASIYFISMIMITKDASSIESK
jgi:hypothetical protein